MKRLLTSLVLATLVVSAPGCGAGKSAYYGFWEQFGYEKRDIFVERVEEARDAQNEAKEEFKTTLQRFQEITGADGGALEAKYNKLKSAYDSCKSRAEKVTGRINSVETVSADLFREWEGEIAQMSNPDLKGKSQQLLADTKGRYAELIATMRRSEAKMPPVLTAFNDQVLFLKANLNAQAISSLQGTAVEIDRDVQSLIADMDASIAEADEFIASLGKK